MALPRIAIIGAGNLSTRRIYPYIGVAGGRICGVCDLQGQKAKANAGRWGGEVYTDWCKMVGDQQPDGVIICISPEAHAELAIEVMQAGFDVYTEKPPAASARQGRGVADVAEETGKLCMTAFKKRYARCYRRARQFIESGEIGEKRLISIDYGSSQFANDGNPRTTFISDFAIHCIDLVRFLFGDVKEVFAASRGPDAYAVSLQFVDGSVGTLSLADGRSSNIPTEEVEITGSDESAMSIHNSCTYRIYSRGEIVEDYEPPMFLSAGDSGIETGHLTELEVFIDAVESGTDRVVSPIAESHKSMILQEAIVESAADGELITLAD